MQIPGLTPTRVDAIWDAVCFVGMNGDKFHVRDVLDQLNKFDGDEASPKAWTLSWQTFKVWALANPNEFHGPASRLEQVGFGRYRMADNPE